MVMLIGHADWKVCSVLLCFCAGGFLVVICHYLGCSCCHAAPLCCCRHAAELRAVGADKLCIVNSEAGLNLGAQLLSDLGTPGTSVALLRRGIDEALAVRTAADNHRRLTGKAGSVGEQEAAAAATAHAGQAEDAAAAGGKKKKKRQIELFVLDGKHAYGLRADLLSRAATPMADLPCVECPLVRQGLEEMEAASSLSSSSSSSSGVTPVDLEGASSAAALVGGSNGAASGLNGSGGAATAAAGLKSSSTGSSPGST